MTLPCIFSHIGIVNNGHHLKNSLVYELIVSYISTDPVKHCLSVCSVLDESVRLVIGDGIFLEVIISWT